MKENPLNKTEAEKPGEKPVKEPNEGKRMATFKPEGEWVQKHVEDFGQEPSFL